MFRSTDGGLTLDPTPVNERILLRVRKPNGEGNHNGGNLAFGPDSLLYAGLGDGGGGNDQHGTTGNAQATNTVHGKILRINVEPQSGYSIPPSNPFAGNDPCSTDDAPDHGALPRDLRASGFATLFAGASTGAPRSSGSVTSDRAQSRKSTASTSAETTAGAASRARETPSSAAEA